MLRIFDNLTQIIFEATFTAELDKTLHFTFVEPFHTCAVLDAEEDVYWLNCFLIKNPIVTKIKIQNHKSKSFINIDLSQCEAICDLTLFGFLKCTALPPNLEKIETETCNLVAPFLLPATTTSFCYTVYGQFFLEISVKHEIEVLVENNPQLKRIIFNCYGEKTQANLFAAISKRSTPLEYLSVINQIYSEEDLKIAIENVVCLQAYLGFSMYKVQYDGPMALKKFIDTGKVIFKNMTGWTLRLEEFHFRQSCSDDHEYDGFQNFLLTHTRMKKIRFKYPTQFHCGKIVDFAKFFSPNLLGEFVCWSQSHTRDVKKHCAFFLPNDMVFWQEEDPNLILFRKCISWLPRLHTNFPLHAQKALYTLALGLTKLKRENFLVHVDPACIEWMLENFTNENFVSRDSRGFLI